MHPFKITACIPEHNVKFVQTISRIKLNYKNYKIQLMMHWKLLYFIYMLSRRRIQDRSSLAINNVNNKL